MFKLTVTSVLSPRLIARGSIDVDTYGPTIVGVGDMTGVGVLVSTVPVGVAPVGVAVAGVPVGVAVAGVPVAVGVVEVPAGVGVVGESNTFSSGLNKPTVVPFFVNLVRLKSLL